MLLGHKLGLTKVLIDGLQTWKPSPISVHSFLGLTALYAWFGIWFRSPISTASSYSEALCTHTSSKHARELKCHYDSILTISDVLNVVTQEDMSLILLESVAFSCQLSSLYLTSLLGPGDRSTDTSRRAPLILFAGATPGIVLVGLRTQFDWHTNIQTFCAIRNVLTATDQMKLILLNHQICLYEITPPSVIHRWFTGESHVDISGTIWQGDVNNWGT